MPLRRRALLLRFPGLHGRCRPRRSACRRRDPGRLEGRSDLLTLSPVRQPCLTPLTCRTICEVHARRPSVIPWSLMTQGPCSSSPRCRTRRGGASRPLLFLNIVSLAASCSHRDRHDLGACLAALDSAVELHPRCSQSCIRDAVPEIPAGLASLDARTSSHLPYRAAGETRSGSTGQRSDIFKLGSRIPKTHQAVGAHDSPVVPA